VPYKNKEDQRAYARKHYQENRDKYLATSKANRKPNKLANRALVNEAKNVPCTDCGVRYPSYVMDFDHLPGSDKVDGIARLLNKRYGVKKLLEEIAKCEVVCSNCHRERTFARSTVQ
jgi:L-lysine 2,3-aminomutase